MLQYERALKTSHWWSKPGKEGQIARVSPQKKHLERSDQSRRAEWWLGRVGLLLFSRCRNSTWEFILEMDDGYGYKSSNVVNTTELHT